MVRAFEPPVYCYHEIVHNRLVVDRFEQLGVVFVDDIAEVPEGRPIMLSAHGSAPEVVAAARARGSVVVNAVCPLVTKVHHEVKRRAGEGYRIVYVGHEATRRRSARWPWRPTSIDLVETVADVAALPDAGRARRPARPDHAVAPRVGRRRRRRPRALPRPVAAGPLRPVLRHHQPPVRPHGDGRRGATPSSSSARPTRRTRGPSSGWPRGRVPAGAAGQRGRRAARRPGRASSA